MIAALNNKSNLEKEEFISYLNEIEKIKTEHDLILCPTYLNIPLYKESKVMLGAQNVSSFKNGAHTGEISSSQLRSFNVKYCIVGHSERRQEEKEDNEFINSKIKLLLEDGITPILCVGETKEQRDNNETETFIKEELESAIEGLSDEEKDQLIIAYEPIWSIGTGVIPTNEDIEKVLTLIKTILPNNKRLYGGSANENNVEELKKVSLIDGYLLGGVSLKPDKLSTFVKKM